MLSPLWFLPVDGRGLLSIGLRSTAALACAASLLAGLAALDRDLRTAYLWAGPSIFTAADRDQMARVREALDEGEVILLYAGADSDNVWQARLWQRGLYPRNPVVVQLDAGPPARLRELRERFAIRHAVVIGPPRFAPRLRAQRDLGPIPGRPGQVSFGEMP